MNDTTMTTSSLDTLSHVAVLATGLESAGWRILSLEMDLSRETARVEVRRADGLGVIFDARDGRSSITRELIDTETVKVGRRGDVSRVERVRSRFVGRTSGMGARQGLRTLCDYLADNAVRPLSAGDVRNLFRPLMNGATHTR